MRQASRIAQQNIQSVDRAARVLLLLGEDSEPLGVSEMARRIGIHKSTVSRLLATLERHDLVSRDSESDLFRLGSAFFRLSEAVARDVALVPQARPILERLAEATDETVNLAVLRGREVFHLDQVECSRFIASTNWAGRAAPAHATSTGKVLLAFAPAPVLEAALASSLPRLTARTRTDPAELRRDLTEVRRLGYALVVGELEEGLTAISAPVFDAGGTCRAAISVSGPSFRLRGPRVREVVDANVAAARDLSLQLGADRPAEPAAPRRESSA
jgi:DNA-binding IclR family transcriptional regulator